MSAGAPWVLRADVGAITTLTLNRPAELNPLSSAMLAALQAEFDAIGANSAVRVVILAARGRAYSAGHHLKEMRAQSSQAWQRQLFDQCSRLMLTITALRQPVIAQVQGVATAAGCQLVATCDLAVAADTATFATSGIDVGLFCTTPGIALSRNVSRKHALEMLLTGEFIDAARAAAIGLVNLVVPEADLTSRTEALAARIAAKSGHAIALGKAAFYRQLDLGLRDAYAYGAEVMACNMLDRDALEGIDAFIEKREPRWDQSPRRDPE